MNLNSQAGQRIRILRNILGLKQSDIAKDLHVSPQQVQKYENGKDNITLNRLQRISHSLGIDPSVLVVESDTLNENKLVDSHLRTILEYVNQHSTFGTLEDGVPSSEILEAMQSLDDIDDTRVRSEIVALLRLLREY